MLRFWNFTPEVLTITYNNGIKVIDTETCDDVQKPDKGVIAVNSVLYGSITLAFNKSKITIATKGDLRLTQCDNDPDTMVIGFEEDE